MTLEAIQAALAAFKNMQPDNWDQEVWDRYVDESPEWLQALVDVAVAAQAVRDFDGGKGFGGNGPSECVFCGAYSYDIDDGVADHEPDCEFRVLRAALAALEQRSAP